VRSWKPVRILHQADQPGHRRKVALHRRPLPARAGADHDAGRGGRCHRQGPLADFSLTDDRYELRIAALLHDCGKVTTPVHVVDKATKLQTLFDRIHLIDTRFEVIRRDAEVRKWRSIAEGMVAEIADATYRDFCRQLEADREALRRANIGCEKWRMPTSNKSARLPGAIDGPLRTASNKPS
jgi:hypothetical protein